MKGYADLLREAQARQNAERRAEQAEAKLAEIASLTGARIDSAAARDVPLPDDSFTRQIHEIATRS